METLDTFSRTFLPATALARIPLATVNRHVNILRGCAGNRDAVAIVAPCSRSDRPLGRGRPENLLMLTDNRLVVTSASVLRRVRLHLNAELHQLADVTWTPEPDRNAIQLALTAIDGAREHFWIRLADASEMWRLDEAFRSAFRSLRAQCAAKPAKPKARIKQAGPVLVTLAA